APVELPLIVQGALVNTLISSRTAKEYHKVANGAVESESLRSPEIKPGTLKADEILAALGTGLYLSNLHYLNWSDRPTGRITGMTRYACFWVEHGEIVAPIENLRFDDSLYRFWGDRLMALSNFQVFIPEVGTYGGREPGGMLVPGALVEDFTYTL
ncbi:MAG: metallopeptidase TldD-related protein, partial [Leptolyngbyaceae bacterium]|nr:metallopeptidase TldD-related protein [Leptolyngbyaceae bacterium]